MRQVSKYEMVIHLPVARVIKNASDGQFDEGEMF